MYINCSNLVSHPRSKPRFLALHAMAAAGVTPRRSKKLSLDILIDQLLQLRSSRPSEGNSVLLSEEDLNCLVAKAKEIFAEQPMLLELEAPMQVVGDVHGQYYDLLRILEYGGSPKDQNYLFLGDYVDRGKNSIECISLLFAYKLKNPEGFSLLRGNHECSSINRIYGFYDECKRRFNVKLWKSFCDAFNFMPVCALIQDRIICMHGGLSPDLRSFDQIRNIDRPAEVEEAGLLVDILWSDPDPIVDDWGVSDRGVSFTFGKDVVKSFLRNHDLDLICRAHQVVEDGYEFFAARKLVTVFSAPNYCGEFDNAGAMMTINDKLYISFQVLKPLLR